jgi:putative FmdB family regulatory protein
MPTYEYACEKCGHAFEKFQSMKDAALTVCPKDLCCKKTWGKGKVKRQMGAGAGLIFKGSGFYITDYRSEGYKQAAKADTGSSAAASKPAETKAASSDKPAKPAKAKKT